MSGSFGVRLQAVVVILLFLGSLFTVLFSTFQTLRLPQGEVEAQQQLREASRRLAEGAEQEFQAQDDDSGHHFEQLNANLRKISERVLRDFPGVEGGFYLSDGIDRFAGYAFPTSEPDRLPENPPPAVRPSRLGDDPPPKESQFILQQAQHSLALETGNYQCDVRTVGPSRVAILTEPVGQNRPAALATWTLFRLTKPEALGGQLFRYKLATGLALGGIALAGILSANLGRILGRQRLDQERLRREQEQLREELRRSEHLATLGKLLAGVAHEVRNPLAGIRSTVQLWERFPETTRTPGSMTAVIHAVDRLNEIVTRLLYFSRADGAERQPVEIAQILRETLELLSAQAATQAVSLECDFDKGSAVVRGSASALRQVCLNLATNAMQAMPRGGRLRCIIRLHTTTRTVEIRFEDTGSGISADDQKHLFEPFFTTRPEGTGLGLALCREIVLQHGGRIELVSSHDAGSIFRMSLPVG